MQTPAETVAYSAVSKHERTKLCPTYPADAPVCEKLPQFLPVIDRAALRNHRTLPQLLQITSGPDWVSQAAVVWHGPLGLVVVVFRRC
jgi:hypothetical protein